MSCSSWFVFMGCWLNCGEHFPGYFLPCGTQTVCLKVTKIALSLSLFVLFPHLLKGQSHAVSGPPPRAEVHRRALQGQEAQPDNGVHRGGHAEGLHPRHSELNRLIHLTVASSTAAEHKHSPSAATERAICRVGGGWPEINSAPISGLRAQWWADWHVIWQRGQNEKICKSVSRWNLKEWRSPPLRGRGKALLRNSSKQAPGEKQIGLYIAF